MSKLKSLEELFAGRHFGREVIILCVRWYLRYKLSLRDLVEMMAERPACRKSAFRLPELDHTRSAVLNSLSSPCSRRNYNLRWSNSSPGIVPTSPCTESSSRPALSSLLGIARIGCGTNGLQR
jgi:hypothetical protein